MVLRAFFGGSGLHVALVGLLFTATTPRPGCSILLRVSTCAWCMSFFSRTRRIARTLLARS